MSIDQKTEMYIAFLKDQGYAPYILRSGCIGFKIEGQGYIITFDEKDEPFFWLAFPYVCKLSAGEDRYALLDACDHANRLSKVVKFYLDDGGAWGSVEMFVANLEDFKTIFPRAVSALRNGIANFMDAMKQHQAKKEVPRVSA